MNDYLSDSGVDVDPDEQSDPDEPVASVESVDPTDDDVFGDDPEEKQSEMVAFLKELPFLIIGALIVAVLVKSFLIQVFWIPSESMVDTLEVGDRVIVNKLSYRFGDPGRGDVIVFEPETLAEESVATKISRNLLESVGLRTPQSDLIKRVIGLPGDTVEARDDQVYVNDVPIDEPYLVEGVRTFDFGPVEVPDGYYFVMGDNRERSNDSRAFGAISRERIVGRAFSIVWPPSRWGGL